MSQILDTTQRRRHCPFFEHFRPAARNLPRYQPVALPDATTAYLTVVGVVRNAKLTALVEDSPRVGTVYRPLAQSPDRVVSLALKTAGEPLSVLGGVALSSPRSASTACSPAR